MGGVGVPQRFGRRLNALGVLASLGIVGPVSARGVQRDDEVERLIDRAVPSLSAAPARSAGVPAPRVVIGVQSPGGHAAAAGRAIVSADGLRTFARTAVTEVLTTELAAAAWTVQAAPASDALYHAMPPPNVRRRGPLVMARPAGVAEIDPALTFDAHQVVAAV